MFRKISIHLTEPICLCEEQKLVWSIIDSADGYGLQVRCTPCGVSILVPNKEFKASFTMERPYPGKPKPKIPVVTPEPGDVVDITEYLKRKRETEPAS